MRLPAFGYFDPTSLEEVFSLLVNHPDAAIKAGGSDLIPRLKYRLLKPKVLINLKGLRDLHYIRMENQGDLCIGALTPLREIETSSLVRDHFPAFADAVAQIGSIEIRNIGTLGGNICLDTRCHFHNQSPLFRKGADACLKSGGSTCHITRMGNQCHALFCADTVPLLIAAGSHVKITSPSGERVITLEDFYTGDGKVPFRLVKNELVEEVRIPRRAKETRAVYLKYRFREAVDFPVVGVAVYGGNEGYAVPFAGIRIVVGGATSRPSRCFRAETLLGNGRVDDKMLERLGETASEELRIVSNSGCSISYRKILVKQLVTRGVRSILGLTA